MGKHLSDLFTKLLFVVIILALLYRGIARVVLLIAPNFLSNVTGIFSIGVVGMMGLFLIKKIFE